MRRLVAVAVAAGVLLAGAGAGTAVLLTSAATTDDSSIFCSSFVPNEKATWQPGKPLAKWASQNPGERDRWDAFQAAICQGGSPATPAVATNHGLALVAAGLMALPEGETTTSTSTTTTTTTTTTPPSTTPIPADGVIRAGGVYASSNFAGQITIATTAAVSITNTRLTYKSATMIKTTTSNPPDLTLDHCTIEGDVWRILDVDAFKRIRLLNNSIEKTAGVTLVGNGDVSVLRNSHHNIQRVPGGVGNLVQLRILQAGTVEIAWNEVVNEYNLSNPEDIISIYHSSGAWIHDNMLWGQFQPGNATASSQGGITVDLYSDGPASSDNRVERNQVVKGMGIVILQDSTPDPMDNNSFLDNRIVASGTLTDNVTKSFVGYQGMRVGPGGSNNHAHGNVVGYMQGTRHGAGRQDWTFDGAHTGEDANNAHLAPYPGTITPAQEQAEWDRWLAKLATAGVVVGS